jgi:hypothetical protein
MFPKWQEASRRYAPAQKSVTDKAGNHGRKRSMAALVWPGRHPRPASQAGICHWAGGMPLILLGASSKAGKYRHGR